MNDTFRIYSTVPSQILKQALMRGTLIASAGGALLLIAGAFLDAHVLSVYGFPIFALAILLVTYGLFPYRRLHQLTTFPDELCLTPTQLFYKRKGEIIMEIPCRWIAAARYHTLEKQPGLEVLLSMENQKEQTTLFFPYFGERKVLALLEQMELGAN